MESQGNSNSEAKLQQTEVHQEQAISELEQRLVQEAVSAVEETKRAIAAIEKNDLRTKIAGFFQRISKAKK